MTVAEVVTRLRYELELVAERFQYRRGRLAPPDRLATALRADLQGADWRERLLASRRTPSARFFAGVAERDEMRRLFAGPYAAERAATAVEAERARQHRFAFFGREFSYGPDIDWQADPVSGRRFPSVFHADVPVHGGDVGYGDVKYVWELSRQQYLIDLGKSFFLDGTVADRDAMVRLVRSWIAGNPYATGVNWACALEPAFRAWSWLWAYHFTSDSLDPDFHLEWLCGFYDHGRFLARHLEHYSSPYNHLIGEASALYALGVLFPEFRESGAWRRLGYQVLHRRLAEQFYADGGTAEQSTFYHHATTGFYLLAGLLARANGEDLPSEVWAAVERAIDFSLHLTQPDGRTPEIGGADDGKPIRLEHLPFWDFRPYLAIGSVIFKRADLKAVAGRFYEDALWLLGPEGLKAFDALPSTPPARTSVLLSASGYAVDRSDWSADADYVLFDVGEQAAGMRSDDVPNAMHGHADCLSVVVWLGGRRVLADSGLYAYNCGGEWEAHFRETAAHNTARVDGRDQALHVGKMVWSHSYRPSIGGRYDDRDQAWTLASHDGFARGPHGVIHRRAVWRRPGGYVVIYDEFTGGGRHDLEVNWQFETGILAQPDTSRARFDEQIDIVWKGSTPWPPRTACGGPQPSDGWICRSLGVRVAAPRLSLRGVMTSSPTTLVTVIADGRRSVVHASEGEKGLDRIAVVQPDAVDLIVAAGATAARGIETDALVAICRVTKEGKVEHMQIGGSYCRVDAAIVAAQGGEQAWAR
jgi:hypothetical protein